MKTKLLLLTVFLTACASPPAPPATPPAPPPAAVDAQYAAPPATKQSGCVSHGPLADAACTPGAVMGISIERICHESTKERRHVTESMKRQVFAAYGLERRQPRGAYEVDHLIPLELGGDNTLANLWPEPASPTPGFHEKDKVESYLHREVCAGRMHIGEAQRIIATEWTTALDKAQGTTPDGDDEPE